jgi:endo-1,4-beta-xylanase
MNTQHTVILSAWVAFASCVAQAQQAPGLSIHRSATADPSANDHTQADRPPLAALKEAYKADFLLGVAINRTIATDISNSDSKVDGNFDGLRADTAAVLHHFNSISPENDLKWALVHPREGEQGYDWKPADAFVEFGERNKMHLVGHTLVWHSQTPNWVFSGNEAGPAANRDGGNRLSARGEYRGPRASREELLDRMRRHIQAVVGRYKGRIHVWDVVNEAIADDGDDVLRNSLWRQIIGDDYIAKAFEFAHQADPDAVLRYNDYGLEHRDKRAKLIKLIKSLQAQGVPVHAIGTQGHITATWPSSEEMELAIVEMKQLGLPIHITELDVNNAELGQRRTTAEITENVAQGALIEKAMERQAEQYANIFRVFRKHRDAIEIVTFWGINDGVSWRAGGKPLLFDAQNKPKPAFDAVLRAAETQR